MNKNALYLALALTFASPAAGYAAETPASDAQTAQKKEERQALVDRMTNMTLSVLADQKKPPEQRTRSLEQGFTNMVDTNWIARFVLGSHWRQASEEQRARFSELYRRYLTRVYVSNYAQSSDRKITAINVLGMQDAADDNFITRTEIKLSTAQSMKVDYLVHEEEPGKYKIIDVTIEGISLLSTHRAEFASLIAKEGIDGVLHTLEATLQNDSPTLTLSMK